uniref:RING-type domain-containing protein n=1 Tax=Caenorhabditis tropicalis TaxID=1561998 RepID=A0A1I7TED7_9PELO
MNAECGICYEEYDWKERIPCIGICGHTICDRCRISMTSKKCPHCVRPDAFKDKNVNKQLWDLIRFTQLVFRKHSFQEEEFSEDTKRCSHCSEPSNKLRVCYDCCIQNGLVHKYMQEAEQKEENIETVLQNIRDQALCGDCVIDGVHFQHKTEYVDSFIESYSRFLNNRN